MLQDKRDAEACVLELLTVLNKRLEYQHSFLCLHLFGFIAWPTPNIKVYRLLHVRYGSVPAVTYILFIFVNNTTQ